MKMIDKYEEKDNAGRKIFQSFCNQESWCKYIKASDKKYSKWDVAYTSGNTHNVIGEIKYRTNYSSDSFSTFMLEVDKLKALQEIRNKAKEKGKEVNVHYIQIFNDNFTYLWDVSNIDLKNYEIKFQLLPKNNFDDTLVYKQVIYLHRSDAERFETNNEYSIFKK